MIGHMLKLTVSLLMAFLLVTGYMPKISLAETNQPVTHNTPGMVSTAPEKISGGSVAGKEGGKKWVWIAVAAVVVAGLAVGAGGGGGGDQTDTGSVSAQW